MNPERQKEIAAKGGRRAQELGHAYRFDSETAKIAGRKGGMALQRRVRADRTPPEAA